MKYFLFHLIHVCDWGINLLERWRHDAGWRLFELDPELSKRSDEEVNGG